MSEPHCEQWRFEPAAAGVYAGLEARSRGLMVVFVVHERCSMSPWPNG